ncbi:MAG: DUF2800 domain-containing protein [Spirochaetales bacterium]|nr:DUF2800 domain-containing protein [Spirochaetales bacterium]
MPGAKHAILSPSASHIWLRCTRAPRMCEDLPDQQTDYARQGTQAHSLCQYKLEKALGYDVRDPREELDLLDEEMESCSDDYVQFVMQLLSEMRQTCSDPVILIEQRLDFSEWVPDGFGYGDCILVADGAIHVIDFKYGEGVLVDARENSQMMCYALGAINLLDNLYDISSVSMTIFQPRRENVSTWTQDKFELLGWADTVLKPAADLAYKGEGTFCAGEHCRFCRARATCRARAEYNLELARYDFAMPDTLEDDEISAILSKIDSLTSWAADIREYALSQALSGKHFEGFKVVNGRSVRRYTSETDVAKAVTDAGFDPYERSILGITAMTKLLGKRRFEEILGQFVIKAPGKPTLVPESDKRQAANSAKNDFSETEDN